MTVSTRRHLALTQSKNFFERDSFILALFGVCLLFGASGLATQDHHQAARTLEEPSGFLPLGSLSATLPVQRCELQFDFGAGRTLRLVCG